MKKIYLVLISMVVGVSMMAQSTTICINEIMQSNIDCYFVEGDFPDSWVELYNPTAKTINLKNWYVSLDNDLSTAYRFRGNRNVPAGGYVVLLCDKVESGKGFHIPFRLESGKGEFYLFNANGTLVDKISYKKMPATNIAYARMTDGGDSWQYAVTPTPGSSNISVFSKDLLPEPVFSLDGQIMTSSQEVTISMPTGKYPSDTRLYVTTDGTEPNTESDSYDNNVSIPVNSTTVLKAKLISANALSPRATTHSYIFHPRITNLPIVSIVTDPDYFYSAEQGLFSNDTLPGNIHPNWYYNWRRPINTEYFKTAGETAIFNQVGETAIGGSTTKSYVQKSLKIYANKRFGTKRYSGTFWEEKPNVQKVKSFTLRNGGNNCYTSRILDAYIQRIFGTHMPNLDYQAYTPVIGYINGEYKGIYGMRERSDEDYVEANYDGLEDIEVQSASAYSSSTGSLFDEFKALYTNENTTYAQICSAMDVDNFNQALIAECFGVNVDYPHNNVSMWRPLADGGKWKWILKDMDFLKNSRLHFNMFDFMFLTAEEGTEEYRQANMTSDRHESHLLYKKMISFPEFQSKFIDGFAIAMGDFLKPEVSSSILESMADEIDAEVAPTFAAYNNMAAYSDFKKGVLNLKTFFLQRPAIVYQQLADYFNLGDVIPMTIKTHNNTVTINGITLTEGDFDGSFFANKSLTITSLVENCRWKMTITHKNGDVNIYKFGNGINDLLLNNYKLDDEDEIKVDFETYMLPGKVSYDLDMSQHKYGSICVPFEFDIPRNLILYRLDGYDKLTGEQLRTRVFRTEANKPYLTRCSTGEIFHLEGDFVETDENAKDYLKNGVLVGVYEDRDAQPYDIVVGCPGLRTFYEVRTPSTIVIPANYAYISSGKDIEIYKISLNDSKYNTVCVPFDFEQPAGTKLYSVVDFDTTNKRMTVQRVYDMKANTPYLIKGTPNTDYIIWGEKQECDKLNPYYLHNGLLVGTYENIYAPTSSYVIPYPTNQKADWYPVKTDNSVMVEENHAYLYMNGTSNALTRGVNPDTTNMEVIDFSESDEIEAIYNVEGVRLPNLRTGLNIVVMKNGETKKIFVK